MNKKAIIFDLDGLLVDTEIVSYNIYKELLSELNIDYTIKDYATYYSGKTEIINVTNLIHTFQLDWSLEEGLEKVLEVEERLIKDGVDLKKGANELLSYLKENNYKIALATSSTKDRAFSILNQHHLVHYFDDYVFAEDVTHSKPHPEVFLKACEKINMNVDDCIVLEDSENGILASYNANIDVICIPDMKIPAQEFLDKTIAVLKSLDQVITLLND